MLQNEIISTDYINDTGEKCTTEANDNIIEISRYDKEIIVYHFGLISLSPTHSYRLNVSKLLKDPIPD